ncbi:MAG: hypothetical protein ACRC62_13105 [Microcoleus sp.]
MNNAMKLRDRLRDMLSAHLGVYTLANGEETPAIYCTEKGDAGHNDRTVRGLEVVVVIVPSSKYVVFLKIWESDITVQTVDLQMICSLIQQQLPIETFDVIEIDEQPELRAMVKLTINSQGIFTFEDDYL